MSSKTLGDYAKIQGGFAYKSSDFSSIGVPVIKIKNVGKGSLLYDDVSYVDESFLQTTSNYITRDNDVLISMTGSNINQPASMVGRVAKVSKNDPISLINQRVGRVVLKKENEIDLKFIYYFLSQTETQYYLVSSASGSANQVNINAKLIESLEIPNFDYETTKKIAHILSTLDEKIELNRKMNQTLESVASAIFKSWFVDFEPVHAKSTCQNENDLENIAKELGISKAILDLFPSEFIESELGMIPKGWEWNKITEVCSSIGSGGTPKRMEDDNFNGEINWFTTKELQNSFVLKSIETITEKGLNTSSAKLFPVNTIVMAIYAAPTVGRLGILTEASTFNQAACGFVADEDKISYEFLFLFLQEKNEYLNNLANGAAQQNLNVGIVKNLDVLVANTNIMQTFKNITKNIFSQIKSNIQQIQALQKTRDTLLPKLLSGEIDVSELEI